MKYINNSSIKKTYEEEYETVILHFEDIRDDYIEEKVLGRIGTINISRGFFQIVPEDDFEYLEKKEFKVPKKVYAIIILMSIIIIFLLVKLYKKYVA